MPRGTVAPAEIDGSAAGAADVGFWILGLAVLQYFEMHVRSGRATGTSHGGKYLTFLYHLTYLCFHRLGMSIAGNKAVTVLHFDQIANWTEAEVAWVNANLEGFKGRVSRDGWVEQAKILASGEDTEFSKRVDKGDVY